MRRVRFVAGIAVALTAVGLLCRTSLSADPKPAPGVFRFCFGPTNFTGLEGQASVRAGFTPVTVATDHTKERGYGWVGATGEFKPGWLETRGTLTSRARKGPNDLLAPWIAGGLPFAVDVPNGKYLVTTSLGDWGEYEFFSFGSYTLLYQGKEVFKSVHTRDNLDQWLYKLRDADYVRGLKLFDRYVKARFDVVTEQVDVTDDKLTVQARVDAGPTQYTGPINYMVVTPADQKAAHEAFLADVERKMRADFDARHPLKEVKEAYADERTEQEKQWGFCPIRNPGQKVYPWTHASRGNRVRELRAFAAPGQFEAIDFAVVPLKKLGAMTAVCSDLAGPNGAKIPSGQVKVGYVKYWDVIDTTARPRAVNVQPYIVMDRNVIPQTDDRLTRQWWMVVHVPADAAGGTYTGTVTVTTEQGQPAAIPLTVDVLPIKLDAPGAVINLCYYYPWKDLYYGNDKEFRDDIRAELQMQRDYGMNSVAVSGPPMPVDNDDVAEWERFIDLYQAVGFDGPIYFAGGILLAKNPKFGNLLDPRQQEAFAAVFQKMDAAAKRKNQPVIYTVVDEGTNDGSEGTSELAARILRERAPEVNTIGDINGYRELMRCAPYLTAAGFNNGWQGSYGINREDHKLIVRTVIERVKAAGCEPWFVNGGLGRYPFGIFLWKMQSIGVKGKVEWHYYTATSDPFNPFDAQEPNAFGSVVFPNRLPTLFLEESRQGIDDLRYVRTLQRVVAEKAKQIDPVMAGRVQTAKEALDYWFDQVPDALDSARTSDGSGWSVGKDFPPARLMEFRQEMAYHLCRLLKIQGPAVCPPEFLLASWETGEQTGWSNGIVPVAEHATHGQMSGRMTFPAGKEAYFDAWGRMRTKDWRGYTSFRFDVFNPLDREVTLTLVLRDQLASNVSAAVAARKTLTFKLKGGANAIVLPLAGLTDDGGKRAVDLSCVFNAFFTVRGAGQDVSLFVDNMRLVQDE